MNIFKTRKELNELKNDIKNFKDEFRYKTNQLEAEILRMKFPNGEIINYGTWIDYKYSSWNEINQRSLCKVDYENDKLVAYKTLIKRQCAYICLHFKNNNDVSERYFIVDISDGKVIECTKQDALNTVDWVFVEGA